MTDDGKKHLDKLKGSRPMRPGSSESDEEPSDESSAAFGYLRGIRDKADAIEVRFLNGNSTWLPYNWLGSWKYNPSNGLLLKFSGDLVYLVLIHGCNLDHPLLDTNTNLTGSGLQRRRIVWMREMTDEEISRVGETGPTIDSIRVAEFESNSELIKWLETNAPSFLP
jgi:hypothetical protein